jgi:hypothetical protein
MFDFWKKNKEEETDVTKLLYCSFCGKSQHEVEKLVAGPSVFICDECTALCVDILFDEDESGNSSFTIEMKKKFGNTNNKEIDIASLGVKPRFNKLKFERKEDYCFFCARFVNPLIRYTLITCGRH